MSPALPRSVWWRRTAVALALAVPAALLALPWPWGATAAGGTAPTHLTLLLPDGAPPDSVQVQAWQAAAEETGFLLDVQSASQLMREGRPAAATVLVVPDGVHQRMNDALVAHIERLVQQGAQLMLVHDAGTATLDGRYHPTGSRLSALAGVRYALYGEWGPDMLTEQVAWVDAAAVPLLQIPPGKLMREGLDSPLTSAQAVPLASEDLALVSYHYGRLHYPGFKTAGTFDGQRLMHGAGNNLIAGVHRVGAGQVLFVNLPLTYLKLRTDGLLLHAFLRYFAQDLVGLPQLAPMAKGQGALIMNWHIDSASAVPAMEQLKGLGAFEQGPYSVHITAGPDVDVPGDGLGMDLARNATMQAWVKFFVSRGDEVGSHGGWIHNEFGRLIATQNRAQSASMIERNTQVVSRASGLPVREYSAPTGSHPAWVTPWLREHGVLAYYFTGDIGMPPTRSFQDGQPGQRDVWAFPVLSHGRQAAFEEAGAQHVPEADLAAWLKDVADFCANARTVRLVYFHPPGVTLFPQAFAAWLRHTRGLLDSGRLHWTTMAQHAHFANRRLQTRWHLEPRSEPAGSPGSGADKAPPAWRLVADHPVSLDELTWLLPADRYTQPQVLQGQAQVQRDGPFWRVTAGPGLHLALGLAAVGTALSPSTPPTPSKESL